jgi:hypothetical protein
MGPKYTLFSWRGINRLLADEGPANPTTWPLDRPRRLVSSFDLGALEMPGGEAQWVQVKNCRRSALTDELDLDLHQIVRERIAAQRAHSAAARSAERENRPGGWQPATADRVTGLLSQRGLLVQRPPPPGCHTISVSEYAPAGSAGNSGSLGRQT